MAEVVGKSRSHVANTLRLLQLPEAVRDHVLAGRLSAGHARAIAAAADPVALAAQVIDRGLNVRETEALVRAEGQPVRSASPRATPSPRMPDADTRVLEEDLEALIGLKVELLDRGGSGEMRIHYGTLEQLDDLCRRLTRG